MSPIVPLAPQPSNLEADFLDLMIDTLTVEHFNGHDEWGRADDFDPPVTYRCRIVAKPRLDRIKTDPSRDESQDLTHVWVASTDIKIEDRCTFPDGSQPQLLQVETFPDENGVHHQELRFG